MYKSHLRVSSEDQLLRQVGTWALVIVIAVMGGSLLTNLAPLRELYDSLFNRQTFVATGDVVLKRLHEQK